MGGARGEGRASCRRREVAVMLRRASGVHRSSGETPHAAAVMEARRGSGDVV